MGEARPLEMVKLSRRWRVTRKARNLGRQRGESQGPGEKLPFARTRLRAFRYCWN